MKYPLRHAICHVEHVPGVEVTWSVPYYWSLPVPATRFEPAEGGVELECDPRPVEISFYGNDRVWTVDDIQEGSILDILIRTRHNLPDDVQWDAANEDAAERLENHRY